MGRIKPENERKDAVVLVPMTRNMRRQLEQEALRDQVPLSELGRGAFEALLRGIAAREAQKANSSKAGPKSSKKR